LIRRKISVITAKQCRHLFHEIRLRLRLLLLPFPCLDLHTSYLRCAFSLPLSCSISLSPLHPPPVSLCSGCLFFLVAPSCSMAASL
jgi:hypothetical protein